MSTLPIPWELRLEGDRSDLAFLSRNFNGPPLEVLFDPTDDCYLLRAASLAFLRTAQQVVDAAQPVLALLSGALRLLRSSEEILMSGAVYRRHADGKRDIALFFHETLKVRSEVTGTLSVAGASATSLPVRASPVVSLVEQAMKDQSVAKALRLLAGDPDTWVGLYRIHEVIDNDVGGERALIKKGWVGSRQLKTIQTLG